MKKNIVIMILILFFTSGCSTLYVVKQGYYQFALLSGAEPLEKVLRSPSLSKEARKKIMLIQDVRAFSQYKLGLKADKNYKDINIHWNKVIYSVSASEKTAFKPYTWWFPVIGSVPYKGFFDEHDAQQEESRLKKLEFDTIMRPIGGYSTLGYFSDPVWPNMLTMSDESLVELIIHELAHATLYYTNQTSFNETFASFVGKTGAQMFFQHHYSIDSEPYKKLITYQNNDKIFIDFFYQVYEQLNSVYESDENQEEKLSKKNAILKQANIDYNNLAKQHGFKQIDWRFVNNAYLLSFKRYNFDEEIFHQLFLMVKANFPVFLNNVRAHADADNPLESLQKYVVTLKKGQG